MCGRHLDPKQRVTSPRNCNQYFHRAVVQRECGEVPVRTAIAVPARWGAIILEFEVYRTVQVRISNFSFPSTTTTTLLHHHSKLTLQDRIQSVNIDREVVGTSRHRWMLLMGQYKVCWPWIYGLSLSDCIHRLQQSLSQVYMQTHGHYRCSTWTFRKLLAENMRHDRRVVVVTIEVL